MVIYNMKKGKTGLNMPKRDNNMNKMPARDAGNNVTLQMQKQHKKQMNSKPSVLFQHMTILMSAQWSKN